jgi:hypothetical protein
MRRVVLDASVLVADQLVTPLISTPLLYEYEDVLKRPEHRHAVEAVKGGANGFLAALASSSEPVEITIVGDHRSVIRPTRWFWRRPSMAARTH